MRDGDIDEVFKRAQAAAPNLDPALLDRISSSIGSSLRPVRPMAPPWLFIAALLAVCAAVAAGGAILLGAFGIRRMNATEIGTIFPVLGMLIWAAAAVSVSEIIQFLFFDSVDSAVAAYPEVLLVVLQNLKRAVIV